MLLACAVPFAVASGKERRAKKVRISVIVILASDKGDFVDRKLQCMARCLKERHPKLKSFRLANLSYKSLTVGKAGLFRLVEGQTTHITVENAADRMDRICLKVGPPMMGAITYETPCGKFLPIETPLRTKKNEMVIIAVRVQPCKGK